MAEAKRVPLLPVKPGSTITNGKTPFDDPLAAKSKDEDEETIRLEISLSDSTETGCPEFSYLKQIKLKMKKIPDSTNKVDPLDNDDTEKLEALAKKFEDKYGPKTSSKGKKRKHEPLHYDIGYGYDETDPFVDNSEAYDELIPSNWTTQHGGFYINQGELHYKQLSDEDSRDFKSPKKKRLSVNKKLKVKLADKSLSKTPKELSTQKRKKQLLIKEKRQKKLENAVLVEKEKLKKKKAKLPADTNSSLPMPQQSTIPESSTSPKISKQQNDNITKTSTHNDPILLTSPDGKNVKNPYVKLENLPDNKSEHGKLLVNNDELIARQKFVKDALANAGRSDVQKSFTSPDKTEVDKKERSTSPSSKEVPKDGEPPQLPENLPLILEAGVQNLKDAALNCSNGKCRFFDNAVNKTLLGVAKILAKLPCKSRTNTYDYLAYYLPCSKDTLVKRAKSLLIEYQVNQLDEPLAKLKEAIEKVMPQQKKTFDAAVANALTEQVREQMKQSAFPPKTDTTTPDSADKSQDLIKSTEKPMTPTEANGKKNIPKRKFIWSEEIRNLLCDVVSVKVQLFKMSKSRSMTAEEYIKDFLENDVRKLWPKGWMTSRILFKESKAAHQDVTQQVNKAKKATKRPEVSETSSTNLLNQDNSQSSKSQSSNQCSSEVTKNPKQKLKDGSFAHLPATTSLPSSKAPNLTNLNTVQKAHSLSFPSHNERESKLVDNRKSACVASKALKANNLSYEAQGSQSVQSRMKEPLKLSSGKMHPASTAITQRPSFASPPKIPTTGDIYSKHSDKPSAKAKTSHFSENTHAPGFSQRPAMNIDKNIRSILDYATSPPKTASKDSSDPLKVPKPTIPVPKGYSEKNLPQQRKERSPGHTHASMSIPGTNEAMWNSKSQIPYAMSHSATSPSHGSSNTIQSAKHLSPPQPPSHPDCALQHHTSPKHTSQQSSTKFVYKTPQKESQISKSTTPPQNALKTPSPHRSVSAASARTSPLVHFPANLEHGRRLSGHSPDDMQRSPIGISHSVSRITTEPQFKPSSLPDPQQAASYDSMSFSNTLSSLSNALASASHHKQPFSQVHEKMQKMASKQSKQMPSQVDLLYQQQQQQQYQRHLSRQTLLQQQQQQKQQQQQQLQQQIPNLTNPNLLENQGSFAMESALSISNMLNYADQNGFSSPMNSLNSFNSLQGSSNSLERYANPYPNYRPKFS